MADGKLSFHDDSGWERIKLITDGNGDKHVGVALSAPVTVTNLRVPFAPAQATAVVGGLVTQTIAAVVDRRHCLQMVRAKTDLAGVMTVRSGATVLMTVDVAAGAEVSIPLTSIHGAMGAALSVDIPATTTARLAVAGYTTADV